MSNQCEVRLFDIFTADTMYKTRTRIMSSSGTPQAHINQVTVSKSDNILDSNKKRQRSPQTRNRDKNSIEIKVKRLPSRSINNPLSLNTKTLGNNETSNYSMPHKSIPKESLTQNQRKLKQFQKASCTSKIDCCKKESIHSKSKGKKQKRRCSNVWERKLTGAQRVSKRLKRLSNSKTINKSNININSHNVIKRSPFKTKAVTKPDTVKIRKCEYVKIKKVKETTEQSIICNRSNETQKNNDKSGHTTKFGQKNVTSIRKTSRQLPLKTTITISDSNTDVKGTTETNGKTQPTEDSKVSNAAHFAEETNVKKSAVEEMPQELNTEITNSLQEAIAEEQKSPVNVSNDEEGGDKTIMCLIDLIKEDVEESEVIIVNIDSIENVTNEGHTLSSIESKTLCETKEENKKVLDESNTIESCSKISIDEDSNKNVERLSSTEDEQAQSNTTHTTPEK